MENEHDKRLAFDLADMRESEVLVYSVSFSGNAYGRDMSGKNQGSIFFHKSQTEKFDIKPGDTVRVRYIPNYEDRRQDVPWRTIYIFPIGRGIAELVAVPPPAPVQNSMSQPEKKQNLLDTLGAFILGNLQAEGRATVEEIAEDMNMSDAAVAAKLAELVAAGRVVRLTCFDLLEDVA
jgi:hypothetical protein